MALVLSLIRSAPLLIVLCHVIITVLAEMRLVQDVPKNSARFMESNMKTHFISIFFVAF